MAKVFVAVLGGAVALVGVLALAWPVSVTGSGGPADQVTCGTGFTGLSESPGNRDSRVEIDAEQSGVFAGTGAASYEAKCSNEIGARRTWAWPVGLVGVVIVVGALVLRATQHPSDARRTPRT